MTKIDFSKRFIRRTLGFVLLSSIVSIPRLASHEHATVKPASDGPSASLMRADNSQPAPTTLTWFHDCYVTGCDG